MDVVVIYLLTEDAGKEDIFLKGEQYKYLVKVRRHQEGDILTLRNEKELSRAYIYEIITIDPRVLHVRLLESKEQKIESEKKLHVGWCIVDTNSVEKVLPMLNELGVKKISFIYCDRSQKNFKPDFNRFGRIVQSSCSQCGRTDIMEFETLKNIGEFIKLYPDAVVFDFCDEVVDSNANIGTILIGSEGGFSQNEKNVLESQKVFRLDTPIVLRSETAVVALASKLLL